jgi:hypothetical protein
VLDQPQISDFEFDQKLKELQALEAAHPEFFDVNSPTQRVGGAITKNFQTVVHDYRMYSLDNSYSKVIDTSNNILGFINGLRWVLKEYRNAGEEFARLDSLINQKLGNLDSIYKKLHILQMLPDNTSMPAVYNALEEYAETAFKDANIVEIYNDMSHMYKKWNILREIMSVQQLFEPKHNEPICAICVSEPISHTVSPCGHTFCSGCIRKMNTSCYICRGAIRDRIRLYFN